MFNRKPKVKLNYSQERKLEVIVTRTGLHVDTVLAKIISEGLDKWLENTNPPKPKPKAKPNPPPVPPTKLIDGTELPYNSDIGIPPAKRGYW